MQNRKEVDRLSAHTRSTKASERHNGDGNKLPNIVQLREPKQDQPDSPFPYLESVLAVAKKHPNGTLMAMIAIASTVIAAVTVLAVSVIGGMFLMYGQMREISATQQTILTQYQETRAEVKETGNVMRAYENVNGKRTEFLISLMDPIQQARYREWERTHPMPLLPAAPKQDKEN